MTPQHPVFQGLSLGISCSIIIVFNMLDSFFGEIMQGSQEAAHDLNDLVGSNVYLNCQAANVARTSKWGGGCEYLFIVALV